MSEIDEILISKFTGIKEMIPVKYGVTAMCQHRNRVKSVNLNIIGSLTYRDGKVLYLIAGQCSCGKVFYRLE